VSQKFADKVRRESEQPPTGGDGIEPTVQATAKPAPEPWVDQAAWRQALEEGGGSWRQASANRPSAALFEGSDLLLDTGPTVPLRFTVGYIPSRPSGVDNVQTYRTNF